MDKTDVDSRKKRFMVINIILILLPLFFFKYFSALNNGILTLLENYNLRWPLPEIKLILPIGLSFYTFMAIGYTIDVYNEEIKSEKNIGILALFISFFPLILSGPIERAKNMLPQFKAIRNPDFTMVVQGFKLMLWGYFMKLVIANRVGIFVDSIYNDISQNNGTSLLVASILYPFQVYADLGGYSLIAIGTAKILGINVMQNFKRPFFATSMSEFWRRWHISLITWLTDYIYTPLSFKYRKLGIWGIVVALMITFLISGIWHGAALTFIVWGLMQGAFLCIEALTNKRRAIFEKKHNLSKKGWYIFIGICSTFILFAASQIFGRAANISDALMVYKKIFTVSGPLFSEGYEHIIYGVSGIIFLLIIEFNQEFFVKNHLPSTAKHWLIEQMVYIFLIIIILLVGVLDGGQFIYFKF
jgi:D-alanyl-lipoteichoic acid acyltransferase DltB (MBOAT superfamily)